MRCEDIQKQFGIDAKLSRLSEAIKKHLIECPTCRQTQVLYNVIDQELKEQYNWQPPPGFAERVGNQGYALLDLESAELRWISWDKVNSALVTSLPSILLGILSAVFFLLFLSNLGILMTSYERFVNSFTNFLLANAIHLAWTTAIVALCFSVTLMRRILR